MRRAARHYKSFQFNYSITMLSLFLRNLFFTILQPGIVAGLVPYRILGSKLNKIFSGSFQFYQYVGMIIFFTGLVIMFHCITRFAVEGRGTLAPADPTKKLVIKGLYKFSRNPMYVGVLLILTGEAILFNSGNLWTYSLFIFLAFYLFVLLIEEPRLGKDFGEDYRKYCKAVRRWL